MKKYIFLFFAVFALISACNGKGSDTPTANTVKSRESASAMAAPSPIATTRQNEVTQQEATGTPDAQTLAIGLKVYKSTCSICHKSGLNGAPRMGSKKDWEPRLAQGKEVLYEHSIHGYRGTKGSMPSRGSNPKLTEAEVKAAVDYIVEHAIPAWSVE